MPAKKFLVAGLLALAAATGATASVSPASAQGIHVEGPMIRHGHAWRDDHRRDDHHGWRGYREQVRFDYLAPQRIRQILRAKGFRAIHDIDRRGRVYEVRAVDHRGRPVGLIVSARSGAILNMNR